MDKEEGLESLTASSETLCKELLGFLGVTLRDSVL